MSHHEHAHHPAQGQAVKDPVCGMDVKPESAAARYEHGGQTYYFCCTHCMEKFRAEP
ncbi:MAG: YHS domain-containing protein, partial [Acidobacteria bacterium]|nr:YHS domain-containing protein [Acidobacteriota bacterium]